MKKFTMNFQKNTIDCVLSTICNKYGERTALIFGDQSISYHDAFIISTGLARNLRRLGIRKNDKIAIILSNSPEYFYLYFACFLAGAWAVPISTRWEHEEVRNVLIDADVTMVFYEKFIGIFNYESMLSSIKDDLPICKRFVPLKSDAPESLSLQALLANNEPPVDSDSFEEILPDDIALLAYTSGTTGTPKGVMIPHRTLVLTSAYCGDILKFGNDDVAFSVAPLYAAQGFLAVLLYLVSGITMKWNYSFNPNDILRELAKGGISIFHTQPTMWTLLLSQPSFDFVDFSAVKWVIVSGSLCSSELARRIEEKAGCILVNIYGLIEATGITTTTRLDDDMETRLRTVGSPIPGVEYRIVNKNRADVEHGEIGELAVRGYVMKGYYKNPKKTSEVIDNDGWLYTGDLACAFSKQGNIQITGRCKDMIVRGGFNVYPIDIEECILRHEFVDDAAVVAKPDDLLGESISAFVVPKAGADISPGDIKRFCRGKIANYKIPDDVHIVSQLPVLLSGKVQKNILREWVISGIPSENMLLLDGKAMVEKAL
jgi:fatty-acyl-CoA synthase